MICSEKERESCNVEKLGCEGCYYNKPSGEEIKNDLAVLSFTHPMFTTMANNTLLYIDYLEQENAKLKEIEAEHKKINGELRTQNKKAIDRLKEYLKMIKQDGIYGYDTEIVEILSILKR